MKAGKKDINRNARRTFTRFRGSVWKCVAYDKKEVEMLNHKYCIINISSKKIIQQN